MTDTHDPRQHVTVDISGLVATVRFNRPEQHNAVSRRMNDQLYDALAAVAQRDDVHVVVLTGAGRSFCPGADLVSADEQAGEEFRRISYHAAVLLHEMPQVTVALINGACAGAGLTWAAACDLRVATERAKFNVAFLDVGVAGDMGGFWTLPRLLGAARARELQFLTGKFDAAHALHIGFVSALFPDDDFPARSAALVASLAAKDPVALRMSKANFLDAERMSFAEYIDVETDRHLSLFSGPEGADRLRRSR